METGYHANKVIELAELVHLFESWGMNKGDAIALGISLVFPEVGYMAEEKVTDLVFSFRH